MKRLFKSRAELELEQQHNTRSAAILLGLRKKEKRKEGTNERRKNERKKGADFSDKTNRDYKLRLVRFSF